MGKISVNDFETVVNMFGFDHPVATAIWNTMHRNSDNQKEFETIYAKWSAGCYLKDHR